MFGDTMVGVYRFVGYCQREYVAYFVDSIAATEFALGNTDYGPNGLYLAVLTRK